MTRQTSAPLADIALNVANRQAREIVRMVRDATGGVVLLDPPYQRGSVWTQDQRIALVRSLVAGLPTGAVIFNDRMTEVWRQHGNEDYDVAYAVVDGKQRIEACMAWFGNELAVPASWFRPNWVEFTIGTEDGPYLTHSGLSTAGQRVTANRMQLGVGITQVDSVQAEAEIYQLINGGGTPQTAATMARAAEIAKSA